MSTKTEREMVDDEQLRENLVAKVKRVIGDVEIHLGDCLQSLKAMPDQSVNCCVTSPPYFGLRDYGMGGQIGLEPTPDEFVAALVEVFREVRRVLRDDGTLWLNLGDSYASTAPGTRNAPQAKGSKANPEQWGNFRPDLRSHGIKPKDLIGIPWRVAFALQADGWYLRQDIIWHKPNPMPESVRDRCTKAHEYVFLLSKGPRYYFDSEAIKEEAVSAGRIPGGNKMIDASRNDAARDMTIPVAETRNRRSVWTVATRPYKGAHFATFPPALIEPCILSGCPEGGTVLDPFGGSGTTAGVALAHDRKAVLCELNPEYADLVPDRARSIINARQASKEKYEPSTQQQEAEPVAIVRFHSAPKPGIEWLIDEVRNGSMLYLHPPAAQALTEQEQNDMGTGAKWRQDSSLETWFPYTAQRLAELEAKAAQPQVPEGYQLVPIKPTSAMLRGGNSEQALRQKYSDPLLTKLWGAMLSAAKEEGK